MTEPAPVTPKEEHSSSWHWWRQLQEEDRAGRAELRRCSTVVEVAFTEPYHQLLRRLGSRLAERDARRVALLAGVLANVESEPEDGASLPAQMGAPGRAGGDRPAVSDVRFRHLLRADNDDDLLRELVRVLRQVDRRANVERLFRDLMHWDEGTRLRWARDYYEAVPTQKQHQS